MNPKKFISLLLPTLILCGCVACGKTKPEEIPKPDEEQIKSICQLSVVEGYFHNVVKYNDKNVERFLWMSKDRHFWVEYTGIAKYGLDASKVTMSISGDEVTISIPKVKVLYCKVDSTSLDNNSYIVDKNSVKITAEDSKQALIDAQSQLEDEVNDCDELITIAQQRAQELMEDYVKNIITMSGKDETSYKINWVYLDEE